MPKLINVGDRCQVKVSVSDLLKEPHPHAPLENEVLYGETLTITELGPDYFRVTANLDRYEGYVRSSALTTDLFFPTDFVKEVEVLVYREPSFKSTQICSLYMGSQIRIVMTHMTPEGNMVLVGELGWVFERCLCPAVWPRGGGVAKQALKFVGRPYAWGRRSSLVDCSALLQSSCIIDGIDCPRDCLPQSRKVGKPVKFNPEDLSFLREDDVVFWTEVEGKSRHVAIMTDPVNCVHATTADPHYKVLVQPLAEVIRDQKRDGNGGITKIRRLSNVPVH